MDLRNRTYLILLESRGRTERYYRDDSGWLKVSLRGRVFRLTAEQVLNHVLPAVAGAKPNVRVRVVRRNSPPRRTTRRTVRAPRGRRPIPSPGRRRPPAT